MNGSQDSMRMSSFVDFEAVGAEDEDLKMILPKRTSPPTCPDRKTMIAEVSLKNEELICTSFDDTYG